MSFQNLSAPLLGVLFAALAGLLFLLHLLRVRPREVRVPTLMFWREAAFDRQRRTLGGRFRHPRTYAFLLVILSLMLLAIGAPETEASLAARGHHVFILDRGAAMGAGDLRTRAREAVEEAIEALPLKDRVAVISAGARARVLAAFSDPRATALNAAREAEVEEAGPAFEEALALARVLLAGRSHPHLTIVTHAGNPGILHALKPLEDVPTRVLRLGAGREVRDRALAGLCFSKGRIHVLIQGTLSGDEDLVARPADGSPGRTWRVAADGRTSRWVDLDAGDLPAGVPIRFGFREDDDLRANDHLTFTLPDEVFVRGLHLEGESSEALRLLVEEDPALRVAGAGEAAAVVRVLPGTGEPSETAAVLEAALLPRPLVPFEDAVLVAAGLRALPPAEEGRVVLSAAGRPLARIMEASPPVLEIVSDVVDPSRSLVRDARGAALLLEILRQVSGVHGRLDLIAAGPTHAARLSPFALADVRWSADAFPAGGAGDVRLVPSGVQREIRAASRDAVLAWLPTVVPEREAADAPPAPEREGGFVPWEILVLFALGLFTLDAWLHARGRIP